VYSVEWEQPAREQAEALPAGALPSYAELVTLLEIGPWSGEPYNSERPDASIRTHVFGGHAEGLVIYLILDDQRRVVVLRVIWAG
jgi:hypothetical protein